MSRLNSAVIFLVFVLVVIAAFMLTGKHNPNFLYIISYAALIFGIGFFYSSYLKKNRVLIVLGSIIFLVGSVFFVFAKYEILGFGTVFIPSMLFIFGISILIANLLTKLDAVSIVFSALSILAGIWLIVNRGASNLNLFFASVYDIVQAYWVIILIGTGVIIFLTKKFRKENQSQD